MTTKISADYKRRRPTFLKMLEDAKAGKFDVIIVIPEHLGDTYEDVMTSLNLVAETQIPLSLVPKDFS